MTERKPTLRKSTADWNGGEPESGSMTRRNRTGHVWARRQVRPDGTVRLLGHTFRPPADAVIQPVPGEWLLLYTYGPHYTDRFGPHCGEWTAPADPDGYLRRMTWELVA